MTTVVVDVGNTRIKWGRGGNGPVSETVSLPADDPDAWKNQIRAWRLDADCQWVIASVHPDRSARLAEWLTNEGHAIHMLQWQELPLRIDLDQPSRVGIDRLLDAVAANSRRPANEPAVIVDTGTAVTIDWVNAKGAFCGGAIFPGLGLMARSLHDHTALLPLLEIRQVPARPPGKTTAEAMEAGIYGAVLGGIEMLVRELGAGATQEPHVFLTGGDAELLAPQLGPAVLFWPTMTLEGIRLTAETLL